MNRKGIAVSAAVLVLLLSGCFSPSSGDPGSLSSESATSSPSEESSVSASSPSSSSGSTERLPTFWLDNPVYVELELEDHLGRPTTYRLNPLLDGNPAGDVHYANSDPSVLSVDKDGLITAVATGTALITANYGPDPSLSDEIEVKVSESAVEIVVPDEIYIGVGETFALAPVLRPATSSDERDYRFLSSDVATATVGTDGTIRGVAGGMCEILVFCVSNYLQKSVLVTVNPQRVPGFLPLARRRRQLPQGKRRRRLCQSHFAHPKRWLWRRYDRKRLSDGRGTGSPENRLRAQKGLRRASLWLLQEGELGFLELRDALK